MKMGLQTMAKASSSSSLTSISYSQKMFVVCNYILLGSACSIIFLILSLRLFPSLPSFFLILLQASTIAASIISCTATATGIPPSSNNNRWYGAHMAATVLTAIFQGSVALLVFTRTGEFLRTVKSYVREEDGEVILRMAGGLCVVIFWFEWVALALAFAMRFYGEREVLDVRGNGGTSVQDDAAKDWPWPFQL